MERKLMTKLKQWKEDKNRKPLIIRGARQVGKTWIMKEFGKRYFDQFVYINFDENRRMKDLFEGNIDPKTILMLLNAETGISIHSETTLIIFDEVQEVPRALTSLKYFYEEAPEYPVIAAGSLLGVALHEGTSFPVGKVSFLNLYPLSFIEFLEACNETALVQLLKDRNQNTFQLLKEKYIERLKQYYFVGGMPEAVRCFVESSDFSAVREIQKDLIDYYRQDFSKHAQTAIIPRLNMVWQSIPMQLAKENKKFFYGQIKQGARAKDFELAIQWLLDCGLIHKVHCVSKPYLPLISYCDFSAFKIYLHDIGLLSAMSNLSSKTLLEGNEIFTEFKGALTEQFVLQQLVAQNDSQLYYYSTPNSRMEIDFLMQVEDHIIPLEVKAEENLRAKSLVTFYQKYSCPICVRTSMSDYRSQDWILNIPLYEISLLEDLVKETFR
ncbi:ATP-binding protein [Faecalicoccus pleomorphus]|uniref:ATP-binding protein n=1 Tax=Faecalicoccus pleomorphus TaxID=1323 RepID=UPI003DA25A7E